MARVRPACSVCPTGRRAVRAAFRGSDSRDLPWTAWVSFQEPADPGRPQVVGVALPDPASSPLRWARPAVPALVRLSRRSGQRAFPA
jgi:hypothetical protein